MIVVAERSYTMPPVPDISGWRLPTCRLPVVAERK
jgi:hypothetical protein